MSGKKKKRQATQWVVMIGYMLIGAACGLLMIMYLEHLSAAGAAKTVRVLHFALMFLCMYGALLVQLIIHEAGHLAFGLYRALMTCDRMYIELIGQNRADVLDRMMTKEQQKIMKAMKSYISVLRTEFAFALLRDRDPGKAEAVRKQFEKSAAAYPYPREAEGERELMAIAEQKV